MSAGAAKSGVPMKMMRIVPRMWPHGRLLGGLALRALDEFFLDPVALQLRKMVDEEDAVDMIDLVLQHAGEQSLGLDLDGVAFEIEKARCDFLGPLHLVGKFGNRETAFLVDRLLVRRPDDFRIDQ